MNRVTHTRQQRLDMQRPELFADQIAERAEHIAAEDWDAVNSGLLLPIVVEDLFSAYVAERGIDPSLTRMDRQFGIFRRKLLNSWRKWLETSRQQPCFAVSRMLHDLLDVRVVGFEKFRVTRKRVDDVQAEEISRSC